MSKESSFADVDELKEWLVGCGYEGTVVLENPDYLSAILGVDAQGRLIYGFDYMVDHLMQEEGWSYEDAVEFIEYNTVRAIPYMGSMGPIICYKILE